MSETLRALLRTTTGHFDAIVCARVKDGRERRRHAALMAVLIGGGLVAALGMPLAGLGLGGMQAPIVAASISGFCLLLAGFLAVTGAFEGVVGGAVAGAAVFLAAAAVASGGVASPLVWLLPVAALEGMLTLRNRAGIACLAIASLALAFVLAASWSGWTGGAASAGEWTIAVLGLLLFGLRRASRMKRRATATPFAAAAAPLEAPGRVLFRFAPGGEIVEASELARDWFGAQPAGERLPFALWAVHVADRVRFLSACGEVREGVGAARCRVRLFIDGEGAFRETGLCFEAQRDRAGVAAIRLCAEAEPEPAAEPGDLQAALDVAQAASEAKTRFLAMVSHELRTPLNAIIGFSDVLDRELFGSFPDPRQKEYVGLIRQSGQHLLSVVNEILDVSKIEAGRYELVPEAFSIGEMLESVAGTIRAEAERKGLRFELANACGFETMTGDRRAIYQAVLNLAANAVKFTDAGMVSVAARSADGFLCVSVTDTGIGIASAEIARLGQPFVQASAGLSRRYPGTGLGLSLAKGFAELHRGSLRITSEIGRGTRVEVFFGLDCDAPSLHNDAEQKVVTLKHARTQETNAAIHETRRSA